MAANSPSFPQSLVAESGTYQAEMVVAAFTRERVEVAPLLSAAGMFLLHGGPGRWDWLGPVA